MHNLSYEDEFYLHENEKSFSYQRLSTYSRFETEAGGTRKWPILLRVMNIELESCSLLYICENKYENCFGYRAEFEQNKRFLQALSEGRISHLTSRIYPSLACVAGGIVGSLCPGKTE